MSDEQSRMNVTSTGLVGTEESFLDAHFEACRPEYEAMLRSVDLEPGWRVLDAACGGGSFLPLITTAVGSSGSVSTFDLAPDNIAVVEERIAGGEFPCPVDARVASLLELPYLDHEFDAIWCANSVEYLDDQELNRALAERAGVSEADLEFWRSQRDPGAPEALVNHPELFWCEGHFVTVGRRPA